MKVPASKPYRQCSLHCRVYVRRHHCCREHLHRLWLYRYAQIHRRPCCHCTGTVPAGSFFEKPFPVLWKTQGQNQMPFVGRDGFLLLYKRLENGSFKWPRKESEVRPISWQQFRWLMEGLEIEQKSIILPAEKASLC